MAELDGLIHQPVRLRIMAALSAVNPGDQLEFTYLRDQLEVTDGNLGAHLQKLEDAGYIDVTKTFEKKKPKTLIRMSGKGRDAFTAHVNALEEILNSSQSSAQTESESE